MTRKTPTKKTEAKGRHGARKERDDDRPLEFDQGWNELEARHDKIKADWSGLAALLGVSSRARPF